MSSDFDRLFAEAAFPALLDQFGEKDGNGAFVPIEYRPLGARTAAPFRWPAILSKVRFAEDYDVTTGDTTRSETRTCEVSAAAAAADNVTHFQPNATITIDGVAWHVSKQETTWGPVMIVFGLRREPLEAKEERRSGSV